MPKTMPVSPSTTVHEARAFLEDARKEPRGCLCPVCRSHRIVKAYRLNELAVRSLCRLYYLWRQTQADGVHRREWSGHEHGQDITFLRFHGLIVVAKGDQDKPYKRSGFWAPTERSVQWLKAKITIPVEVYVDDNKKIGESPEEWTVRDALGHRWNPEDPYLPMPKKHRRKKNDS